MKKINILAPDLPESVIDANVVIWHKKVGDNVQRDEILVEIETDKVILEISAPESGVLETILANKDAKIISKQVLGQISINNISSDKNKKSISIKSSSITKQNKEDNVHILSPAVRRLVAKYSLRSEEIDKGSGIKGRLTKNDILKHIAISQQNLTTLNKNNIVPLSTPIVTTLNKRGKKRVPMTRLRKLIAERLLAVKNNTAMLTTFNEVNMKSIMDLREQYGLDFEKQYGVRVGLMSFYVKAVLSALKRFPEINASIDGEDIVYYDYFDINIAISTLRGLVTPVLRNVDIMSIADIEKKIKELATKARDGQLKVEELTGGNFTITNGGVFGSLMSTPIINPPQVAILGMHAIKDRPIAINNQVVISPMMYLALSYDHRIIDGKESVNFLLTIKEILENPMRLLLEI